MSEPDGSGGGWIVYLTGRSQALNARYATEFDAMVAAEAVLRPGGEEPD